MKSVTRREFIKTSAKVLATGALAPGLIGCASKALPTGPKDPKGPLRFIHATDSHLDLARPKTVRWIEILVEKINRDFASVDFVLFGGDNFNNNVPGRDDALRFKKIVDELHCPYYSVRGNKESTPKPKTDPLNQKDFAAMFFPSNVEVVGRDWKLEWGRYTILGIDTTLEQGNNGIFTPASLAFVEEELKNHPDRYHVVLNHQVYDNFWGSTDEKDIHKYVLNNADEAKERLFGYKNLSLTLSGHKHLDHVKRQGPVTVAATVGFVVPQKNNDDDHRFRHVEIQDGSVSERQVSIV